MVIKWGKQGQTGTYTDDLELARMKWNLCWSLSIYACNFGDRHSAGETGALCHRAKARLAHKLKVLREAIWKDLAFQAWLLPCPEVSCRGVTVCLGCDRQATGMESDFCFTSSSSKLRPHISGTVSKLAKCYS